MRILSIIALLILTSCASTSDSEQAKKNNQEAIRIMLPSDRIK